MGTLGLCISGEFSKTVFKMVMKHSHHFGYDTRTRELLELLPKIISYPYGTLEFRIENDFLLMSRKYIFHGNYDAFRNRATYFRICPHLEYDSTKQLDGVATVIIES